MSRRFLTFFVFVLTALLVPTLSFAQDQGGGGGGNQQGGGGGGGRNRGGGGPGGGNFDPAQFRQRMMDRLKEELGATDDEWKVLEPKVDKVMTAQQSARAGGGFGGFGRRGGGGGMGPGGDTPTAQAARDLRTTLDNKDAPASEITAKLTALRDARAKARAELESAQKDLKEVLTPRQEAVLVVNGMLE
jgi:hypothetical protein